MGFKSDRGLVAAGSGRVACKVNRRDALMYVGYAGQELDARLAKRFEELACKCEGTCDVSYVWRIEELQGDSDDKSLAGCGSAAGNDVVLAASGLALPGADIARHLEGARLVAIFAATLGARCQMELERLGAVNALDHLLFDCCASSLTEAGAQAVQDILGQQAVKLGLCAHARFSPGYGDLPLAVQPAFLDALGATARLGLTVTKDNFLLPAKSVTAVLGLFDQDAVDTSCNPCDLCAAFEYCCYRERNTTCSKERAKQSAR